MSDDKRYPRGKLRHDDDGEVSMTLAIQDNTLLIVFPYAVTWLGLGLAQVEGLIKGLQEKAELLKKTSA